MRAWCLFGLLAMVAAWLVIGAAWAINSSWFDFWSHAFSDLGVPGRAFRPWVYNYGLIATGGLAIAYSLGLYRWARYKLEVVAASFMGLAGVFLALIGVFPGGTRPHVFVSTWFFVQVDMALIPLAYSLWRYRGYRPALAALAASLAGFPVYIAIEALWGWPSVAAAEAYGILVIDIALAIIVWGQCSGR